MKIIVVSFYQTFPPTFDSASVTYNLTKHLPGEKYLIHLGSNEKNRIPESNISLVNIKCTTNTNFMKFLNMTIKFPKITAKIKQLAPEFIVLEGAAWVLYYLILFLFLKFNKIESKIIYHGHCVEYLLRKEKNNIFITIIAKWAEGIMLRKSDFVSAVSEIDAIHFEEIYGVKPYILPNGVDVEKFDNVTDEEINRIKKKYNLNGKIVLFMGLPFFKPNKEAIDFLVRNVFPPVNRENPDAELAIIGGEIAYKRKWLINPGSIPYEEVPVFIKACDVCVAPIFSGSGTRLKILEYMAAGKPVVSTTKGAEGITVIKDGENIIIADDANNFAKKIVYLLKNQELAKKIGNEGMQAVIENYSWQKIMQNFNKTLYAYCVKNRKNQLP